jgi:hypothetical protein
MRTSGRSLSSLALLVTLGACSARGSSGGTFSPPPGTDASGTTEGGTTEGGTTSPPGQCERSCMGLVACLGTVAGSMGQCVSSCQARSVTAACHACLQSNCVGGCGMACANCLLTGGPCEGVGMPPPPPPPDNCAAATNCNACASMANCGWCNNRCYRGTSTGPTGASCGASPWAWTTSACGGAPAA